MKMSLFRIKRKPSYSVKTQTWISGFLETIEHLFDSLEKAIEHANTSTAHVIKIYDADGQLVYTICATGFATYA